MCIRDRDTGDIILKAKMSIGINDTTGEVYHKLMHLGAQTLVKALEMCIRDSHGIDQNSPDPGFNRLPMIIIFNII